MRAEHSFLLAWHNVREIAEYAGLQERTTQRALQRLQDAGLVKRIQGGKYSCYSIKYPGQETPERRWAIGEQHAEAMNRAAATEQPRLL